MNKGAQISQITAPNDKLLSLYFANTKLGN